MPFRAIEGGLLSPRHQRRGQPRTSSEMSCLAEECSVVSDLQKCRRLFVPPLPYSLERVPLGVQVQDPIVVQEKLLKLIDIDSQAKLRELFPSTYSSEVVTLVPREDGRTAPEARGATTRRLRVGVVLSGGQAAGGHNVIAGLFDYCQKISPNSQVFGFLDGPKGVVSGKHKLITSELLSSFRNMGGFDLLGSGRDKIETPDQLRASMDVCVGLGLDGLVVIGGDDSNTNAAVLAEYFQAGGCRTVVVGCPKTIDGDLKNEMVEISFGFDTACKTYCEEIGNVCADAVSSKDFFAFVRLMGRSASHITLECAMHTRVNLALIGEEIARNKTTLREIVNDLADLVLERKGMGKNYGVFLFPEGLIEFIPEIGALIRQLNEVASFRDPLEVANSLSQESAVVWESLPLIIREQLLLDRDPHGNVQVAKIATEQLLILMVEDELQRRLRCSEDELESWFKAVNLYFGYEGRSCMPSDFDSAYCTALGFAAGGLVSAGKTGYMATITGLANPVSQWTPGGCPLVLMMTMERRKGKEKPVIKKYLVDLEGPQFKAFAEVRDEWKTLDCYSQPGPLQFSGGEIVANNYMLSPPTPDQLSPKADVGGKGGQRIEWMSHLQKERLDFVPSFTAELLDSRVRCTRQVSLPPQVRGLKRSVASAYPNLVHALGNNVTYLETPPVGTQTYATFINPLRIGVAFIGQQSPGCENIVWGIHWRIRQCGPPGSVVVGFFGAKGLVEGNYRELSEEDIGLYRNQGGLGMLGKDGGWGTEYEMLSSGENFEAILAVCQSARLDGLVLVGGPYTLTEAALLSEYFIAQSCACKIVTVPATVNNNIRHPLIECSVGFHSASHAYASLVGNLLTDCASAKKYYYFIRLMSNDPSTTVLEAALQTNPHVTVVSEKYAREGGDIFDVVRDIADVVETRHVDGSDWGVVLIPEGLISHLSTTKQLMKEAVQVDAAYALSPWARALLEALPCGFEKQLFGSKSKTTGRFSLTHVKTEEILAEMVQLELIKRKGGAGFNYVTFFLGLLGRSAMPSNFDCSLGLSLGMQAALCVESGLTGVCAFAQNLCKEPEKWQLGAMPLTALMSAAGPKAVPTVPSTSMDLNSKAYKSVSGRVGKGGDDSFGNPGPMQLAGSEYLRPRVLLADHGNKTILTDKLTGYLKFIHQLACHSGIGLSEDLLRTSVIHLKALSDILCASQDESAIDIIRSYHENVLGLPTEQG